MRMLGYDSLFYMSTSPSRFLEDAGAADRIAVTAATRKTDRRGPQPLVLRSVETTRRISEIFSLLPESPRFQPFTICLECNTPVEKREKEKVTGNVPEKILARFEEFFFCPGCRKIYWKGSHYEAMQKEIDRIRDVCRARGGNAP